MTTPNLEDGNLELSGSITSEEEAPATLVETSRPVEETTEITVAAAVAPVMSVDQIWMTCVRFTRSGRFKQNKTAEQAFVSIMAGQELGIGAYTAMNNLHIIEGKVTMSAALVGAMVKKSPEYDYRIVQHDVQQCEIAFFERGQDVGHSTFTMADAQQANLVKAGGAWNTYPKAMLFARALTQGARWYTPNVFMGAIYTPDELGAQVRIGATDDDIEYDVAGINLVDDKVGAANAANAIAAPQVVPPVVPTVTQTLAQPAPVAQARQYPPGAPTTGPFAPYDPNSGYAQKPEQTACNQHPGYWFNQTPNMAAKGMTFRHPPTDAEVAANPSARWHERPATDPLVGQAPVQPVMVVGEMNAQAEQLPW